MSNNSQTHANNTSNPSVDDVVDRFLEFSLGSEYYAIPLLKVKEVIAVPHMTPIPNAPSYFQGIMNLRGQVISIVDLRKKLNIKPQEANEEEAVIIVDLNNINIGVIVDSVSTVLSLTRSQVSAPPETDTKIKTDYMLGVVFNEKKMTVLVNIGKILNIKDFDTVNSVDKIAA